MYVFFRILKINMMFCHIYWRTKNIDDLRGIPLERVNEKKRSCSAMESNHSSTQDLNQRKLSNQQFSEHPHPTIPLPHPLYKTKITFVLPWTLSFPNTFFFLHIPPILAWPSQHHPTSQLANWMATPVRFFTGTLSYLSKPLQRCG